MRSLCLLLVVGLAACTGTPGLRGADGPEGPPGPEGVSGAVGAAGQSVTSTSLTAGDPNCPNGGSKLTSASGDTYVCNGAPGPQGIIGPQGPGGPAVSPWRLVAVANSSVAGTGTTGSGYTVPGDMDVIIVFLSATTELSLAVADSVSLVNWFRLGNTFTGRVRLTTSVVPGQSFTEGVLIDGRTSNYTDATDLWDSNSDFIRLSASREILLFDSSNVTDCGLYIFER